jgi:hypothetical protein
VGDVFDRAGVVDGLPGRYLFTPSSPRWFEARGGPVFEMWQSLGYDVHIVRGAEASPVRHPAWTFFPVVPRPEVVAMLDRWKRYEGTVAVVDVCFPMGRPDCYVGLDGPDRAAIAAWTDPLVRRAGFAVVGAADAVTVPHAHWDGYPGWIDDLAEHNPNVYVLPDLDAADPDAEARFAGRLLSVWRSTVRTKQQLRAARARRSGGGLR